MNEILLKERTVDTVNKQALLQYYKQRMIMKMKIIKLHLIEEL